MAARPSSACCARWRRPFAPSRSASPRMSRRVRARLAKAGTRPAPMRGDAGRSPIEVAPHLLQAMDHVDGGLKGAPKFPNTPILEFLWRAGGGCGARSYRSAVRLTLAHMSEGGIYDHLGGGYARYSTDERWLAPHFEKMLYDNAQILELLALAYHETGDELFRARAGETVGWLEREMTAAGGAFCASLDADSEGVEGKFYVWTWDEIVAMLGHEDARFFGGFYNASPIGNWTEAHYPGAVTILNRLEFEPPDSRGGGAARAAAAEAVRRAGEAHSSRPRRQDHGRLERADDRRAGQCRNVASRAALDRPCGAGL